MDEVSDWAEKAATGQVPDWIEVQDIALIDAFNRAYADVFGSGPSDRVSIARAGNALRVSLSGGTLIMESVAEADEQDEIEHAAFTFADNDRQNEFF